MTQFNLYYLFKDTLSKYGHILKYWSLGLHYMSFGANTIQPITMCQTPN